MRARSMAGAALMLAVAGSLVAARRVNTEEAAVRAALQHYIEGHRTGIKAEYKAAMNAQGTMYFVRDGALTLRPFPEFYAGADGKIADDESSRKRRIELVDIVGNAALGKIILEYPDVTFTDYMGLLKIDGKWQIVAKSFHADRKGTPPAPPATDADKAEVRTALQHYLNGHATGSADEFKAGMHTQGTMYGLREGQLSTMPFTEYFSRAGSGKAADDEANRKRRIDLVDVRGTAAVGKITLEYPRATFTDYMQLLKVDGKWQIVAKTVYVAPKGS